MTKSSSKFSAVWLSTSVQAYQMRIADQLYNRGVKIDFVSSLEQLSQRLKQKRTLVLILSDQGDGAYLESNFKKFISLPDAVGMRLILDQTLGRPDFAELALLNGFRDIIPAGIPVDEWIDRFMFSASFGPYRFSEPNFQLLSHQPVSFELPARIVQLSNDTIRLETRLDPELGSTILLRGELARSLGTAPLAARVKRKDKQNLSHRYGQAIELEPIVEDKSRLVYLSVIRDLASLKGSQARRVFVVATDPNLRSKIFDRYQALQQIVRTAVNKSSVFEDPRFFSPELVLIENKFCIDKNLDVFLKMLSVLRKDCVCVVIGDLPNLETITMKFPQVKFLSAPMNTSDFGSFLSSLPPKVADSEMIELPLQHALTTARVCVPVTLSKQHPQTGELISEVAIANFALGWLDYPGLTSRLGRKPILKVTSVGKTSKSGRDNGGDDYQLKFYFADLALQDRVTLNNWLHEQFIAELDFWGGTVQRFAKPYSSAKPKADEVIPPSQPSAISKLPDLPKKPIAKPKIDPEKLLKLMAWSAAAIILGGSFYWLIFSVGSKQMDKLGEQYSKPIVDYKRRQDIEKTDKSKDQSFDNQNSDEDSSGKP